MLNFKQKLPQGVKVCDWTKERSEGYIEVGHFGRPYYIPVTKEMKRLFGISRRGSKLGFKTMRGDMDAEKFLRETVGALLSQVGQAVGDGIQQELNQKLTTFLTETLEPHFEEMIQGKIDQHLLPEGKGTDETEVA